MQKNGKGINHSETGWKDFTAPFIAKAEILILTIIVIYFNK